MFVEQNKNPFWPPKNRWRSHEARRMFLLVQTVIVDVAGVLSEKKSQWIVLITLIVQ